MDDTGKVLLQELDNAIARAVPNTSNEHKEEFENNMANAHRALVITLQRHEQIMRRMNMKHLIDINYSAVKEACKIIKNQKVLGVFPTMPPAKA